MDYPDSILKKQLDLAGRTLVMETGKIGKQAGGAVFVSYEDTCLLTTATAFISKAKMKLIQTQLQSKVAYNSPI